MALSTQYVKLQIGSILCIKDFPDIDPHGETDQIEVTTLCDEYHEYIDGLKNYPDSLEFTLNYDEAQFNSLNFKDYNSATNYNAGNYARHNGVIYVATSSTTGAWDSTKWSALSVNLLLCNSSSDVTGKNGKFTISQSDVGVRLSGAGVGDVLEMIVTVKPKSAITFSTVA